MDALNDALRQGLTTLGLVLSDNQVVNLLAYLTLIQKWNKVYNLTSVRDPAEMMTHHLLDSLAVIQPLQRQLTQLQDFSKAGQVVAPIQKPVVRLLDVGSGAGLPGVVIAICCPELRVDCVDTVGKKTAFIQQVAASLKLPNLRGIHARVESLTDRYGVITSRAFASLLDFTNWSVAALEGSGVWLAMKGKHPAQELAALPKTVAVFHVEQLTVPGLDAERCLIWLRPATASA